MQGDINTTTATLNSNENVAHATERIFDPNLSKTGSDISELAGDLLRGAEEIAAFLFGDKSYRRKVYHLAETSRLPVFRLGSILCARRSVLMSWIAKQEQRGLQSDSAKR